jgi:hypothetical protein
MFYIHTRARERERERESAVAKARQLSTKIDSSSSFFYSQGNVSSYLLYTNIYATCAKLSSYKISFGLSSVHGEL